MNQKKTLDYCFNQKDFLFNFLGMEDIALEMINQFIAKLPLLIENIQLAITVKNGKELEISAHTLVGVLSNFHAHPSKSLCLKLEKMGMDQKFDEVDSVFLELKKELTFLQEALQILIKENMGRKRKKTILIVDDSEIDRQLMSNALSRKGNFLTLEAGHFKEFEEMISTKEIDIILMDIMMPDVAGTDILLKIREKYNPVELPIIMVTSKADPAQIVSSLQAGANDYIIKPINFDIALSRIMMHLNFVEVSVEMSKLKERAGLDAMIATYNHEIINPLTIALGCLSAPDLNILSIKNKLSDALWKINTVVKKISEVTSKKELEYQNQKGSIKLINIS